MRLRDVALGAVGGLVAGLIAGWALARVGEPSPLALPAPLAVAAVAPARVSRAGNPARAEPQVVDLAALVAAQDAQIRELSVEAFGLPLVWPDAMEPGAEAQRIRDAVAACVAGVRLIEADCTEPPCITALDLGAGARQLDESCPGLWERLDMNGYSSMLKPCADGAQHSLVVLQGGGRQALEAANQVDGVDFSQNVGTRVRIRTKDLQETLACPE